MSWPKLSETLHPLLWGACQRCAVQGVLHHELVVWQEHDDHDKPTPVAVVLCKRCSEVIEPHPRLYARVSANTPLPGVMELCRECIWRRGYLCGHPNLTVNGGPGLEIQYPRPTVAMVDGVRNGRRTGWREVWWSGPPTGCAGRELPPAEKRAEDRAAGDDVPAGPLSS